jgi:23S rRNA (uracil1939-C5)-methyltransferase
MVTLKLMQMAHGGPAIGRYQGKVFFVPYALPGETVAVEVEISKKGWARTRLVEVIEPSPERVSPPCPHFGPEACGGCQWQHIRYPAQLAYKTDVVRDQLARLGGLTDVLVRPTRAVGEPWSYRNHVQLHPSSGGLGYVAADGQRVEPINTCPIMHPLVAELLDELDIDIEGLERLSLRAGVNTGQQMVIFETIDDESFELMVDRPVSCVLMQGNGTPVVLVGNDHLFERVAGHEYRVSAGSFFQVNTPGAEALVDTVASYLSPHPYETLLDLYCGVGLFSLALAPRVAQVIAVEAHPAAVADARFNVEAAGLDNVRVIEGDVADILITLDEPVHAAIADPPRSGCGPEVAARLAALGPRRLVYVAYDPATLARDAKTLAAAGYRLVEVQPLDLFPQTYHIESVGLFVRNRLKSGAGSGGLAHRSPLGKSPPHDFSDSL